MVGSALRRGRPPLRALHDAFDELLYQGVRPSVKPLTRAEAADRLLAGHCSAHHAVAERLLATLAPGGGLPRES